MSQIFLSDSHILCPRLSIKVDYNTFLRKLWFKQPPAFLLKGNFKGNFLEEIFFSIIQFHSCKMKTKWEEQFFSKKSLEIIQFDVLYMYCIIEIVAPKYNSRKPQNWPKMHPTHQRVKFLKRPLFDSEWITSSNWILRVFSKKNALPTFFWFNHSFLPRAMWLDVKFQVQMLVLS